MRKHAGPGPESRRPERTGFRAEACLGRSGPGLGARPSLTLTAAVLLPALLWALAPLPSLAQDGGEAPPGSPEVPGSPDIYVNTKLLERLASERPAPGPSDAPRVRPLLQAPPAWQLESRLYVVPLGQSGPAEAAQAPPAPSVLTSELESLEGRRAGAARREAVVKPRPAPPRPEKAEAEPGPVDQAAARATAVAPGESEGPETTEPPPPEGPGGEATAAEAAAESPAPSPAEVAAATPGAPPAPATILGELAEREEPRPSKITAPPVPEPPVPEPQVPEPPTPSGTEAAEVSANAEAAAPIPPQSAAPPAPAPEERLGPATPAVDAPDDGGPQLTARPPAKAPLEGRILFEAGSTELSPEARSILDGLAARLLTADAEAVELRAYATGLDPRRLSLNRGLVARGYLEKQGVAVDKVFLRPLGDKAPEGPAERIDYELVTP